MDSARAALLVRADARGHRMGRGEEGERGPMSETLDRWKAVAKEHGDECERLRTDLARITAERDEARADARAVMDDLQRIVPELGAKLMAARAVVDAARAFVGACDAESADWTRDELSASNTLASALSAYDAAASAKGGA